MAEHGSHEDIIREMALKADKEDLAAILTMRFGGIPDEILAGIGEIAKLEVVERLILVAANAASWDVFLTEFRDGQESFKIIGEEFNPLAKTKK